MHTKNSKVLVSKIIIQKQGDNQLKSKVKIFKETLCVAMDAMLQYNPEARRGTRWRKGYLCLRL